MSGIKRTKEVLLTLQEAQTKKTPKGYAWVPIVDPSAVPPAPIPVEPIVAPAPVSPESDSALGKRPRKKKDYSEYISPASRKHVTKNGTKRQKTAHSAYEDSNGDDIGEVAVLEEKPSSKERKKLLQQQLQELLLLEDKLAKTMEQKRPMSDAASPPTTVASPLASVTSADALPMDATAAAATPSTAEVLPSPSSPNGVPFAADNGAAEDHDHPAASPTSGTAVPAPKRRVPKAPRARPAPPPPISRSPPAASLETTPGGRSQRAKRARRSYYEDEPTELSEGLRQCQQLVKLLMSHKYSWPFNQPVDPIALNIPDYFDIIKEPMDLGTIAEQLESGSYDSPEEFHDHVQLVFQNAMTYNPPGSDICIMAQHLKELFEKKWGTVRHREQRRAAELGGFVGQQLRDVANAVQMLQKEVENMKHSVSGKSPGTGGGGGGGGGIGGTKLGGSKGRPGPASNKKMSFEQKKALSEAINTLDSEELVMVIKIIHERMPRLAQNSDPEEIEVDIDALDNNTLRELEKYVRGCLMKKRKRNPVAAAAADRLEAAARAEQGTAQRIEAVQKRLEEINKHIGIGGAPGMLGGTAATSSSSSSSAGGSSLSGGGIIPTKVTKADTEDFVDVGDDSQSRPYPSVVIDKEESSESESSSDDSESDSDSSDSSDSESEDEKGSAPMVTPSMPVGTLATAPASSPPALAPALSAVASPVSTPLVTTGAPQVAPAVTPMEVDTPNGGPPAPKAVVLQNLDSWKALDDDPTKGGGTAPPSSDGRDALWSEFRHKELQEKRREMDRAEQEERLRRERQEREEERRKAEEHRRRELEEVQAKRLREEKEAELEAQRKLEAERERAKEERRKLSSKRALDMTEQSVLMASFEKDVGNKPLEALRLKETEEREAGGSQSTTTPTD